MTLDGRRARVFGEVADEYDRIRPGYPAALVDDGVQAWHWTDPAIREALGPEVVVSMRTALAMARVPARR
jgi:hypothetical protein